MPMSGPVPSIGSVVKRRGRRLRRLVSTQTELGVRYNGYFKNYQIARNSPEARKADAYDERGTPMFKGRSRAADFAKRASDKGVEMEFDG